MWVRFVLLSIVFSGCRSSDGDHHDNSPSAMMMGVTQLPVVNPNPEPARDQNQDKEELWKQQLLDLLNQMVQAQREAAEGQAEVIRLLGTLGSQGSEQIQNLQNLARHQSLLVENHQALLLQTSRIATQLQDLIKKPNNPPPPLIHLNSEFQSNQSEVVVNSGTTLTLHCHGNGSVQWSRFTVVTVFGLDDPLLLEKVNPKNTGTYRCGYADQNLRHLDTWIHLYVKYPTNSKHVFVTPRRSSLIVKEGEDFLFRCLLTDPSVKNITLQRVDRRQGLPHGMNVTFDPKRGALIRDAQLSYKGTYVCSGQRDGGEFKSAPMELQVKPRVPSPLLSVSQDEVILLVGEEFKVMCSVISHSNFYTLTWTHSHRQMLDIVSDPGYNGLYRQTQTLTVSEVNLTDSGMYTCTVDSDAGVTTATTHLTVIDRPYLKIYLHVPQHANASSSVVEANGHLVSNVSTNRTVDGSVDRVHINGSSRMEVSEGRDVMLSFRLEAYPPITEHHWMTPKHITSDNDTVYEESYTSDGYRLEARLLLRRLRREDRGQYSLHFSNSFFSGSQTINLKIHYPPSAKITLENNTLTCQSSGYPLPIIQWFTCPGQQDRCGTDSTNQLSVTDEADEEEEELEVESEELMQEEEEDEEEEVEYMPLLPSDGDDVTVTCFATNHMGEALHVAHIRQPVSPITTISTLFTPLLIGALSSAAVLFLFLLVALYKWKQKPRYEIRWKIIESTDGNHYTFVDPTQLLYNQKWEFPRDKLRLGAVLGSGAFGKVVEATAYGLGTDNNGTRVAVKMLKPSAHSEEREALMSELKILSHLGYHDNIVNLLGACTRGGPMLMITEYCCHGDLLNFLRSEAEDFMASILNVDEAKEEVFYKNMTSLNARLRSDSGISCCSDYQEMQPVLSPGQVQSGVLTHSLSVEELMRFSYQVAQGLDFLSTRNCIHRDVAARNVLLTDRRIAKICDFGLARDIRNDDSYIVQGNARLPVKWMAPESIFQCIYTVQSDVWSYGVLLWEIFSLGKSPYPNIAVDTNFYKMIKDGRHMDQPDFAPAEMYELMTLCWNLEATQRPTFKTIGQLIRRLLPSVSDKMQHHKDQSMYRNISECQEEEEDEEVRGGDKLKGEDEEHGQRDRRPEAEEMEPMINNIYQLS